MRILLFGEYSGFYNTLKDGLQKLNHDVLLVGRSDSFKKYSLDISFDSTFFNYKLPNVLRQGIYRIFKSDIADIEIFLRFYFNRKKLGNFDAVQLINEFPFQIHPTLEKICLKYIFKHNKNVYLSACGDDTIYINFLLNSNLQYHLLNPYQKDKSLKPFYKHSLMFLKKKQIRLHEYVFNNIKAIIPADIDYFMAYKSHLKSASLIPYPINLDRFKHQKVNVDDKIVIFHGINAVNYYKKGNDFFEKALDIIKQKYPKKAEVILAKDLPYSEYIKKYNSCHILLDQVYSYDQGYNALEAMAKGKVVFTGAENDFIEFYNLNKPVVVNTRPDVNTIVDSLSNLIENPEEITVISKNARDFIEKEHNYIECAKKYVKIWSS